MRRILVLGTSGVGKTTLARTLAERLSVPLLELDAIHWQFNWTPATDEEKTPVIERHVEQEGWVVDGNYASTRRLILPRADAIVWLDYSMTVTFARVARRTFWRWWNEEELWNGNREALWTQLCSKDSILLWVLTTWRERRRAFAPLLREQCALGKRVLRFRTPRDTQRWLDRVAPSAGSSTPA